MIIFSRFILGLLAGALLFGGLAVPAATAEEKPSTRFYLVGLGPGSPDLMTLRAAKVVEQADVVFCAPASVQKLGERLQGKTVHRDYWRLFPYYGREPSEFQGDERRECEEYAAKRAEMAKLVRAAVQEGKTVAVLDAGDPLVYGPSAWTLEEFEDLDPVVVPGLSAFNAGNAALRRGVTNGVRTKSVTLTAGDFITTDDTIERLAAQRNTMVIFTMRTEFRDFIAKLSAHYPPETPIAIVKHAGYADKQSVVESTLGRALDDVKAEELPFEYLIYVGDALGHRLKKSPPR